MKCLRLECLEERRTAGMCLGCGFPLYCSETCRTADAEMHRLNCGRRFTLEDFEDVKTGKRTQVLGKGSYGEVKLVVHKPTSTYFALKTISKEQAANSEQLAVLRRETAIHQQLSHPNIIKLYGSLEDLDNFYIILEYAEKGNLYHEVRKRRGLPEDKAKSYFLQVCAGIQYLHERLVVHRDLKPENLLLNSRDEIKICDFGWCVEGLEIRSTFCGTVDYMAPEMILGGGHSFAVDIWALGILLYEMVHGSAPWTAVKDAAKTEQILDLKYVCDAGINPEIQDLIHSILKLDPEQRPSASQIFLHPWLHQSKPKSDLEVKPYRRPLKHKPKELPKEVQKPEKVEENVEIGSMVKCYLKGFGMAEGMVTELEENVCTVFFEVNSSYQQIQMEKIMSLMHPQVVGKAEESIPPDLNDGGGAGLDMPRPITPPLKLRPEDEAEILDKIEKWCKQPSKVPVKEDSFLRELDESKRRLEQSLAELQVKGVEDNPVWKPEDPLPQAKFEPKIDSQPLRLPSFLQEDQNYRDSVISEVAEPWPQKHRQEAKKEDSDDEAEANYARPELVPDIPEYLLEERHYMKRQPKLAVEDVLMRARDRELDQKLAKQQEELLKITQELDDPVLPKVKKIEEKKGVISWFGELFK